MAQRRRQRLISDLLRTRSIHSQWELVEALRAAGETVTQATVSRDLAELGVLKGRGGYYLPDGPPPGSPNGSGEGHVASIMRRHGASAQAADSLVVVRTAPGHASVVADALDRWPPKACAGTIAGDDTVFVATASAAAAKRLAASLRRALEGEEASR